MTPSLSSPCACECRLAITCVFKHARMHVSPPAYVHARMHVTPSLSSPWACECRLAITCVVYVHAGMHTGMQDTSSTCVYVDARMHVGMQDTPSLPEACEDALHVCMHVHTCVCAHMRMCITSCLPETSRKRSMLNCAAAGSCSFTCHK